MNREQNYIEIRGARVHNLKGIDLDIPINSFVVITGVSGSGKSSLAFDTLYAEGQRRYVESLSSYARQFLGRMNRPDVDFIGGIPPAIAIEQRVNSHNPRSTVGTTSEIYDYMRLLFARVGKTISPFSGREVKRYSADDVTDFIALLPGDTRVAITAPANIPAGGKEDEFLEFLNKQGYMRLEIGGDIVRIDNLAAEGNQKRLIAGKTNVVIDRITASMGKEETGRVADSIETAFQTGRGICSILVFNEGGFSRHNFSANFEEDGTIFIEPTEHLFSFNNPLGACPQCEGYGKTIGIDEDLVIPDKNLSVYQGAVACWRGDSMKRWSDRLIKNADRFNFPVHRPWYKLTDQERDLVWNGNRYFFGLNDFFQHLEAKKYKIQYRVLLSRYRGKTTCPLCRGSRLRKEAEYVKVDGRSITELAEISIADLFSFFDNYSPKDEEREVGVRILTEIRERLRFLLNVGLPYLTLARASATLSGGESQRINLATALGSSLVGSLYILDEPSIGLHPRDTALLTEVLHDLRDLGNTVVVVEHDESIIRSADYIIDMGPLAGRNGGEVVLTGTRDTIEKGDSLTAGYLSGKLRIEVPARRRKWNSFIEIKGARENNLRNVDVKVPLRVTTCITGVSGSGKTTLINEVLYRSLLFRITGNSSLRPGEHTNISGDVEQLKGIELIDQKPAGRSSRSNPVTYLKAYDEIRKLFAREQSSVQMGLTASHFSFNVPGGRCEECKGDGIIRVEMQFMADVELTCDICNGKRFSTDVLSVKYNGLTILKVLELTVDEALTFFSSPDDKLAQKVTKKIRPLADVGLGYIQLGQSSSTFSGGEIQRLKLASFIGQENRGGHTLFIFDEPTTGLHFHDIAKLLDSIDLLVEKGHSAIMIEHNPEVIKSADWIIDLGPDGGNMGGEVIFTGVPEDIVRCDRSHTGRYLKDSI